MTPCKLTEYIQVDIYAVLCNITAEYNGLSHGKTCSAPYVAYAKASRFISNVLENKRVVLIETARYTF